MRITRENFLFTLLTIGVAVVVFVKLQELPGKTADILMVFVKVLATISALIFTIPLFFKRSREESIHDKSDEKWVIIYLFAFLLGIFFSLSTLFLKEDKLIFFKFSLIIFLGCLIWLIPYLFLFLKRDTIKVIETIKKSVFDELDHITSEDIRVREENLRIKIDYLERITLQALSNRNYLALDYSITCLKEINYGIMRRTEIADEIGNSLVKEIMRSFRDLSIACIECKFDENSRRIGKHMKELVMNGLRKEKNFEYPNLVLNIEKLGIEAARKHLEETTDEILNSLGQIGDQSMKIEDLQRSPVFAVLKSLQNIGIVCIEEKMIHQCSTARTRLFGIAELGKQKEQENIFHEALKRFWVVTAYTYTYIPEIEEANYELENKLKEEFGNIFVQTIDEAIEMLRIESEWVQRQIVKEFKNTFEFLKNDSF